MCATDGCIEVWSPTQIGNIAQTEIAQLAGIPPENVIVHMTLSGGSFGRRFQWDYLAESYQVAKEMKVPVQLLWTPGRRYAARFLPAIFVSTSDRRSGR